MPKQTRLGDNAEIYQRRVEKSEREKLSEMPFKKKVSYLWEYYKYHAFVSVAVIAFLVYIIVEIVTPDIKTILYAAVINNPVDATVIDEFKADFSEQLQLDPKREEVDINTQFYYTGDNEYTMSLKQVLVTYVAAQEVDIIIAPESEYYTYAYNGFLAPLSDQLPSDLYSFLADYFYLSSMTDDPQEDVYGIYINDTGFLGNSLIDISGDPYVLGMVANSTHKENTIEFIRYLFK